MTQFLSYTISGLSLAAILAVGASGLVLTYTATGVFNFAHGAIGMLGAFAYWQLRFDWGWPAPVAVLVVLGILAPLFGALLEVGIFRGLQHTTEAVKLVVTVSLLFSIIGIAGWIWDPLAQRPANRFFFGSSFSIGDVVVQYHEATTIAVAVVVAIALRLLLYGTRSGVAMRAAVDDRSLASLHGARPERSSMLAWAIGCALAATSGILFVGTISLDPTSMSLLIVNAYAAAMIGRLRSLPLTFLGAVILGLARAYVPAYVIPEGNQYFASSFVATIPVIVLFVVLLVLPSPRLRAHGATRTRETVPVPSARGSLVFAAAIVATVALAIPLVSRADAVPMARLFGLAIVALSLVPLIGFGGQVSLAQWSFAGIGAVTFAHLGTGGSAMGIVWAVLFSAVIGGLIALPALRLSGIYLALATAAFAVFLERWVFNLPAFDLPFSDVRISIFGTGSLSVERLELFGFAFDTEHRQLMLIATTFALLTLLVAWMRRAPFGRRLLAMKDSPAACATIGMNLFATKLAVFAISAGMAGLGGALLGGLERTTNPSAWTFAAGLPVFMVGVVGGIGRVGGALFAGVSLALLQKMPTWPLLRDVSWFPKLANVTPGLMGIGLGRNPNGAVADMREAFGALGRSPRMLGVFLTVLAGLYAAVVATDQGAWWLILGGVVALIVCTHFAANRERPKAGAAAVDPVVDPADDPFAAMPLEWVGIDRAFTPEDRRELEAHLGLVESR